MWVWALRFSLSFWSFFFCAKEVARLVTSWARLGAGVIPLLLLMGGCASYSHQYPTLKSPSGEPRQQELEDTPFHPQAAWQCGPAALATLLEVSGVADADPVDLAAQVYLPGLRGSLQSELLGAARRADRVPYRLEPRLADLLEEIRAGYPVLVLQNLGLSFWPQWHYAVVIGFDMDAEEIILRSGRSPRRVMSFRHFERTWRLGGHWALVIARPGDIPATATASRYVEAVSTLEAQQRREAAIIAYTAAAVRWPTYPLSYLGLGNMAYQKADYEGAEAYFHMVIELSPDEPAAHYNLAWTYLRQGRTSEALGAARQAEALASGNARYTDSVRAISEAARSE